MRERANLVHSDSLLILNGNRDIEYNGAFALSKMNSDLDISERVTSENWMNIVSRLTRSPASDGYARPSSNRFSSGSSLPGVVDKGSMVKHDNQWYHTQPHHYSTHIIKGQFAVDEWIGIEIMRCVGVSAATTELVIVDEDLPPLLASERFDRVVREQSGKTSIRSVHQEDILALMGRSPASKYFNHAGGTASLKEVGAVLQAVCDRASCLSMVESIAVNLCLLNADCHWKNWAVLDTEVGKTLAPRYDVVSQHDLPDYSRFFPFRIGQTENPEKVRTRDWLLVGEYLGLGDDAVDVVQGVPMRVNVATDAAITELRSILPRKMIVRYERKIQMIQSKTQDSCKRLLRNI